MHLAVTWEVFMDLVTWEVNMVDMWEGDLADTWDNSSPLIHTFHIHHPLAEDTYKIFNISSVIYQIMNISTINTIQFQIGS